MGYFTGALLLLLSSSLHLDATNYNQSQHLEYQTIKLQPVTFPTQFQRMTYPMKFQPVTYLMKHQISVYPMKFKKADYSKKSHTVNYTLNYEPAVHPKKLESVAYPTESQTALYPRQLQHNFKRVHPIMLQPQPSLMEFKPATSTIEFQPVVSPMESQPVFHPQDCFEKQVEQLVERVAASAAQSRALEVMQRDVEDTLSTVWPGCKVKLFGSLSTGLGTSGSDVDFTVFLAHQHNDDVISLATTAFQASNIYHNIHTRTRLPAITFQYKPLDISCDLNFKNEGTYESELLNYLLTLDDRAFKLAYIIKYWAKLHRLVRPKYLTSYGLMMMVIFYLQQISILPSVFDLQLDCPAVILNSTSNFNVAFSRKKITSSYYVGLYQILGRFFEFYANFNFSEFIISPYTGRAVEKMFFKELKTVPNEFKQYKINVQNNISKPLNLTAVCVQSLLMLNDNCAWRVDNSSEFVDYFRNGAKSYRYFSKCTFLEAIGIDLANFI